ncbi:MULTISPECIES: IS110 family transposase [unclassified Coleofasciculus]|uniref:IS110 family transposase n=1 Tax=unclassified Coleofasciculus TaxID=2692782 RepID=UPI00187FC890|nr:MULTISPECIES: transposase [unclassified Coleofasciculus]MBE9124892.1 transposase [Coleofasciculus sp. LEGE 07081]MBE9147864.1 transposase [Coleofasciculus sp. LEGE 07092]
MNRKILGGDICKDRVVCWLLEDKPDHLRNFWKSQLKSRSKDPVEDTQTFYFTKTGISHLLKLKPDVIVLEPTGVHYSWLLAHICHCEGIEVLWVGHCEATHYRKSNKLPDKNDLADALALAAYAHHYWGKPDQFLQFEPGAIVQIKDLYLQMKSLTRVQSPIINRVRQQLCREFPEAAFKDSKVGKDGLTPLWAWLGNVERQGVRQNFYYDRLYDKSVAPAYGIEISQFSQRYAQLLCQIHSWEHEAEKKLAELIHLPQFKRYNQIFDKFGIGLRLGALLLCHIYPLSKFESLGSFKKRLGMAGDEISSGDRKGWNAGSGSKMCRTELYLWILCIIAPKKNRPTGEIGQKLGDFYDTRHEQFETNNEGNGNTFGKLIISQTAAYGTKLLFKELKKALMLKN